MYFLDKMIDKRIARYQSDLLATHYAEVENMYRQIRGWRHDYRNHIQVTADASVPVALTTAEIDLCIIIGNLFDNAIEACMELPKEERLIRVYMDMKNTQLYMSFTNTTAGKKLNKSQGRFLSGKGAGHGYGLVRIDTIVERYQGYLNRNSEDGAFTMEILLPQ